ncbi:type III PLP-dependent enzyme [Burkholderia gladioli]|uniref:type III PLP-dependent enzyme n=1 Tax=Burkholderia gladioli TaxID=28095 RepID=UPI00164099D4|nr:type III PLP-dependent enzyme [Burkholderia gladioli]
MAELLELGRVGTGFDAVRVALRDGIETPAYVYDLAALRTNVARLRSALPEAAGLYYSLKANPHPVVLVALRDAGLLPEVCSPGELTAALEAGWSPEAVFYSGPGKRDREVSDALRAGVRFFCADSPAALDQLSALASAVRVDVRCLVRINDAQPVAGQGLAMTGVASQFGADLDWVLADPRRFADREHLRVTGLHLYMGSNLSSVDDLNCQFEHALRTAARLNSVLSREGVAIDTLNLGGGFGAPFAQPGEPLALDTLHDSLCALLDAHAAGWRHGLPRIVFESGRYLAGTAGTLVTRVLDVKQSHGKEVVVLESGINHLGGMSGLRRLPPLNPHLIAPRGDGPDTPAIVAGPLCTPLDSWSRNAPLPPLRIGDVLAVPNVGAYGLYASLLAFLGHPAPAEAVVDGDRVVSHTRLDIIRKDAL